MSNAFEKELIEKISNWQKEMAHKIIALEERLEALEKLYSSIDHLFQRIEALEEKFDKLMKLSDDYYKTDRTVIYDYANKIEALEEKVKDINKRANRILDHDSTIYVSGLQKKIEALEAELENNKYKEEDEWLEGK